MRYKLDGERTYFSHYFTISPESLSVQETWLMEQKTPTYMFGQYGRCIVGALDKQQGNGQQVLARPKIPNA